jgi:NMD protein affecting ribosome stability and mRNA decay
MRQEHHKRAAYTGDLNWFFPDSQFADQEDIPGPAVCSRCHAYLETDHWLYDERRSNALRDQPDVHLTLCPGCLRVERRLYEGEVIVHHDWSEVAKTDALNLIHNEEARARATNPSARIALMEDRDGELYILTTTQFLAERIGKELKKAFKGSLKVMPLPRERFTRVRWAA